MPEPIRPTGPTRAPATIVSLPNLVHGRLADLVAAAAASGRPEELAGECLARATYRVLSASWRPTRRRLVGTPAMVAVVSAASLLLATTGLAAASDLPAPATTVVAGILGSVGWRVGPQPAAPTASASPSAAPAAAPSSTRGAVPASGGIVPVGGMQPADCARTAVGCAAARHRAGAPRGARSQPSRPAHATGSVGSSPHTVAPSPHTVAPSPSPAPSSLSVVAAARAAATPPVGTRGHTRQAPAHPVAAVPVVRTVWTGSGGFLGGGTSRGGNLGSGSTPGATPGGCGAVATGTAGARSCDRAGTPSRSGRHRAPTPGPTGSTIADAPGTPGALPEVTGA
jgi:hypothetical protein